MGISKIAIFPPKKFWSSRNSKNLKNLTAILSNSKFSRSNWSTLRCVYLFHTRAFSLLIVVVLVTWPAGHFKDREALLADGEVHLVTGLGKNPGLKKNQPSDFFRVFLCGFFCFFLGFWVFYYRFAAEGIVFRVFQLQEYFKCIQTLNKNHSY